MNAMLDRVEEANQRQRRFVADASHELRSPLTRIRSEIEVDLAHPESADADATERSVLAEAIGLQHLVDDLLHLARSDDGAGELARGPVDLDDLVLREARRMRERGRVEIDTTGVSAAQIDGDAAQLSRVVRNLAENAERHAQTRVRLAVVEQPDGAELTIADDGPGIPPEHREMVFERFTRLDGARTREAGGAGVGLAIVRDIVERHHGTVTVDDEPGGGARFTVHLPG
jgi:signal transduction histidine kinase